MRGTSENGRGGGEGCRIGPGVEGPGVSVLWENMSPLVLVSQEGGGRKGKGRIPPFFLASHWVFGCLSLGCSVTWWLP